VTTEFPAAKSDTNYSRWLLVPTPTTRPPHMPADHEGLKLTHYKLIACTSISEAARQSWATAVNAREYSNPQFYPYHSGR